MIRGEVEGIKQDLSYIRTKEELLRETSGQTHAAQSVVTMHIDVKAM